MGGDYMSYELCMENVGKRDIQTFTVMINVRPCTITGPLPVSCKSCKICPWEEKF